MLGWDSRLQPNIFVNLKCSGAYIINKFQIREAMLAEIKLY